MSRDPMRVTDRLVNTILNRVDRERAAGRKQRTGKLSSTESRDRIVSWTNPDFTKPTFLFAEREFRQSAGTIIAPQKNIVPEGLTSSTISDNRVLYQNYQAEKIVSARRPKRLRKKPKPRQIYQSLREAIESVCSGDADTRRIFGRLNIPTRYN
jgi:hypothetical protein